MLIGIAGFSATVAAVIGGVRVLRKGQTERLLLPLAEMRTSGVELRNRGSLAMDKPEREAWFNEVDAWERLLYKQVERLSRSASEELRTLNTFPILSLPKIQDQNVVRKVSELTETLKRLKELIRRYR